MADWFPDFEEFLRSIRDGDYDFSESSIKSDLEYWNRLVPKWLDEAKKDPRQFVSEFYDNDTVE